MPTATPFNAGVGNGFTECLSRVDVSSFDFWTTLGGNRQGGGVTESGQGLAQAMAIFWNLNGVSGNYTQVSVPVNVDFALLIDGEAGTFDSFSWTKIGGGSVLGFFTPMDRVCYTSFSSIVREEDTDDDIDVLFQVRGEPIRMYNGSTSNEGNFVGYGCQRFVNIEQAGGNVFFDSRFRLLTHVTPDSDFADDAKYVEINGMHFVASFLEGDENPGATVTITENASEVKCVASDGAFGTETFIIDKPLDLFTY